MSRKLGRWREELFSSSKNTRSQVLLKLFISIWQGQVSLVSRKKHTKYSYPASEATNVVSLWEWGGEYKSGRLVSFPSQRFPHSRGNKVTAVPPQLPLCDWRSRCQLTPSKAARNCCLPIFRKKKKASFYTPEMTPGFFIFYYLPHSTPSNMSNMSNPGPAEQVRTSPGRSRACTVPYFVTRHHASVFIHAL